LNATGTSPREIVSRRSKAYRERQAEVDAMSDEQLIAAMVAEPTLLRRPLVVEGGRLVAGFDRDQIACLVASSSEAGTPTGEEQC
jgi:arsenate reductase-like glutaredoxin family protein